MAGTQKSLPWLVFVPPCLREPCVPSLQDGTHKLKNNQCSLIRHLFYKPLQQGYNREVGENTRVGV
jgi:hypothetical protein